jgi:integrase
LEYGIIVDGIPGRPILRKSHLIWGIPAQTPFFSTLLGHSDVKTTMIHTHVLNRGPARVRSPVDGL